METSTAISSVKRSVPTLEAQVQRKLDTLFPPAEGRRWLDTAQPQFGASPRELLARGEGERVLRVLTRLEQGISI